MCCTDAAGGASSRIASGCPRPRGWQANRPPKIPHPAGLFVRVTGFRQVGRSALQGADRAMVDGAWPPAAATRASRSGRSKRIIRTGRSRSSSRCANAAAPSTSLASNGPHSRSTQDDPVDATQPTPDVPARCRTCASGHRAASASRPIASPPAPCSTRTPAAPA